MLNPIRLDYTLNLARESEDEEEKLSCLRAAITLSIYEPSNAAELINEILPEPLYTRLLFDLLSVDDSEWNIATIVILAQRSDPELDKIIQRLAQESEDRRMSGIYQILMENRPPCKTPP